MPSPSCCILFPCIAHAFSTSRKHGIGFDVFSSHRQLRTILLILLLWKSLLAPWPWRQMPGHAAAARHHPYPPWARNGWVRACQSTRAGTWEHTPLQCAHGNGIILCDTSTQRRPRYSGFPGENLGVLPQNSIVAVYISRPRFKPRSCGPGHPEYGTLRAVHGAGYADGTCADG